MLGHGRKDSQAYKNKECIKKGHTLIVYPQLARPQHNSNSSCQFGLDLT